jgi:ABC-type transport system substrate-binding protein
MPDVVEAWEKMNNAIGNEAITRAAKEYDEILFKKLFRVPLWSAHVAYAVNQRVESYDPVPGLIFPIRFEYIKLKD